METLTIYKWKLRLDREATRAAFTGIPTGAPELCGCSHCTNFVAQREHIYPPPVIEVFDQLGIDPRKESEICHYNGDENGVQHYGGWFHFVGSIESGPELF